jgi:hypothetical protein
MRRITVKILMQDGDGKGREYVHDAEEEGEPRESGEEAFASELFEYVRAELTWPRHIQSLEIAEGLTASATSDPQIAMPLAIFNDMNRQELWREIQNTLYEIRHGLAQAKAYKDIEPPGEVEHWFSAHSRKVSHLNVAALYLAKIQDLVVRLLFESFGGDDFIKVNSSNEDWEKALLMSNARDGLKRLHAAGELSSSVYHAITEALNEPAKSKNQELVVRYRNRVAHRVRPSIDHWELSPVIQNREGKPILDKDGKTKGRTWAVVGHPTKADFDFGVLYEGMADYLVHLNRMLERLKAIPRLA